MRDFYEQTVNISAPAAYSTQDLVVSSGALCLYMIRIAVRGNGAVLHFQSANASVAAVAFKAVVLHITGVVHRVPYAILLDHAVMTGALLPIIGANHRCIGMVIRHLFKLDLS